MTSVIPPFKQILKIPDPITNVTFSDINNSLLCSSWSHILRLYGDCETNTSAIEKSHGNDNIAAILDCCFSSNDSTIAFSSGLDHSIYSHNFASDSPSIMVGNHEKPVSCVEFSSTRNVVVSGGWDRKMKVWDLREDLNLNKNESVQTRGKVYALDVKDDLVLLGCSGRFVDVFDLRNLSKAVEERMSPLDYQTRCIKALPDGSGFVISSTEGRVAIEHFLSYDQAKNYSFKCHRKKIKNNDENNDDSSPHETIYPVNAIAFHMQGTFATGGCDGMVNVWDGTNRKKVSQIGKTPYPASIASLSINQKGNLIAIASSKLYPSKDNKEEEEEKGSNVIYIRRLEAFEVNKKARRSQK
eukprot:g4197.t1